MAKFRVGDRVRDRAVDEDVELIVLDPDRGDASEVRIDALDATVASVNEDWPADDPVVECVHVEWLDRHVGDWDEWERNTFPEQLRAYTDEWSLPLRTYHYPESRLALAHPREDAADSSDGQSSIEDWSR